MDGGENPDHFTHEFLLAVLSMLLNQALGNHVFFLDDYVTKHVLHACDNFTDLLFRNAHRSSGSWSCRREDATVLLVWR